MGNASVWSVPGFDLVLLNVMAHDLQIPTLSDLFAFEGQKKLTALPWDPGGVPDPVEADLMPLDPRLAGLLTVRLGVTEGNSGSGLFDAQCRLAGIIVNKFDEKRAVGVPVAWVKTIIDLADAGSEVRQRGYAPGQP